MPRSRREFLTIVGAAALMSGCLNDEESQVVNDANDDANNELPGSEFAGNEPEAVVDVPLLNALWQLEPLIQERFPDAGRGGIASLGMYFGEPDALTRSDYACTPLNSLDVAWTGGDGEHFGCVLKDVDGVSTADSTSPICLTAPSNSGEENCIVAASFRDLLRLGLRRGFLALPQFLYNPELALEVYGSTEVKPESLSSHAAGYLPHEPTQQILAFVEEALELEPLAYTPGSFEALQQKYLPMLRFS